MKVLEKFDDSVTSVHLGIAVSVFDAAFFEDVVKGEGGFKLLVSFDFDDTAYDVAFKHNIHESVANIGSVEERDIVAQKLISLVSNFHERRLSVKVYDRGIVTVDDFIVEMCRKNGRKFL